MVETAQTLPSAPQAGGIIPNAQQAPLIKAQNVVNAKQVSVEAAPAPKRSKKKKTQDRHIPVKVAHIIPESTLFNKLLDEEKRIDTVLKRKRTSVYDALQGVEPVRKRLRLYLYHEHVNQDKSVEGEPPAWTLKIYGRVIDKQEEPRVKAEGSGVSGSGSLHPPPLPGVFLTNVMRSIHVSLPGGASGDPQTLLKWEKDKHHVEQKNEFEVKRMGAQEVTVDISLHHNWNPPRYHLAPTLASVLGLQLATRPRVLESIWSYIQLHHLQNPEDPTMVDLDPPLVAALGTKRVPVNELSLAINKALTPPPPVKISYTIKPSGPSPSPVECYDIDVELTPRITGTKSSSFLDKLLLDREVEALEQKISQSVLKINEHRRRRAFYLGFSQSPVDFIHALVASQSRDLRIAKAATSRDYEVEMASETFQGQWVEDAVLKYLHKRGASGH